MSLGAGGGGAGGLGPWQVHERAAGVPGALVPHTHVCVYVCVLKNNKPKCVGVARIQLMHCPGSLAVPQGLRVNAESAAKALERTRELFREVS